MKIKTLTIVAAMLAAATFIGMPARAAAAAPIVWSGADCAGASAPATPNCKFSDANNWVGGAAPKDGDAVQFDSTGNYPASGTNLTNDLTGVAFAGISLAAPSSDPPNNIYFNIDTVTLKSGVTVSQWSSGYNFSGAVNNVIAQGDLTIDVNGAQEFYVRNALSVTGNLIFANSNKTSTGPWGATLNGSVTVNGAVIVGTNVSLNIYGTLTSKEGKGIVINSDGVLNLNQPATNQNECGGYSPDSVACVYTTPWKVDMPITLNDGALLIINGSGTKDKPVEVNLAALMVDGDAKIQVAQFTTVDATTATIKSGSLTQDFGATGGTLKTAASEQAIADAAAKDQKISDLEAQLKVAQAAKANAAAAPGTPGTGVGGLALKNPAFIMLGGLLAAGAVFATKRKLSAHR